MSEPETRLRTYQWQEWEHICDKNRWDAVTLHVTRKLGPEGPWPAFIKGTTYEAFFCPICGVPLELR